MTIRKRAYEGFSSDAVVETTYNSPVFIVQKNRSATLKKRLMIDFSKLNSVAKYNSSVPIFSHLNGHEHLTKNPIFFK